MDINDHNEILNHCRINQFLNKATEKLHEIFCDRWYTYKELEGHNDEAEWISTKKYGDMLLSLCPSLPSHMAEIIHTGNIDLWDVTLTTTAIQGVTDAIRSFGGNSDKEEDKYIYELKRIRNEVSHNREFKLFDSDYMKYCDQLTNVLIKAGSKSFDIKIFRKKLMEFGQPKFIEVMSEPKIIEIPSEPKIVEVVIDENAKFLQLKDEANSLLKDRKFTEAIEKYNQALDLSGITPEKQALLYSNRSAAYLMLNTSDSLLMAKRDAEYAIRLWPCWWRAYYRLGRVEVELKDWGAADVTLKKALALNPESKEVLHELSVVRAERGVLLRHENYDPSLQPQSVDEIAKEASTRLGVSEEEMNKITKNIFKSEAFSSNKGKGHQYREGWGVERDYAMAASYFAKSAREGDAEGMYMLGLHHYEGKGVVRDFSLALDWLKKAAKSKPPREPKGSGVPEAQHKLGMMYADGIGVKRDYHEAAKWYEKAIDNGSETSANNLAVLYQFGQGVEKSEKKSFYYFKLAAEKGDTRGMMNLAQCYFDSNGTEPSWSKDQNIAEGKRWLKVAEQKGDMMATQVLESYEKNLPHPLANKEEKYEEMIVKTNPLDQDEYGKHIKEAAKNKSVTAQQLLEIWGLMNDSMNAFKKANYDEVCANLCKAIRLDHEIAEVPELLKLTVEKRIITHPGDINTIICFVWLNSKNQQLLEIVEGYLKKFPNDPFLIEMSISGLIQHKRHQEALSLCKLALKLYPKSLRFLYIYAIALDSKEKEIQTLETIKAFDTFINEAPIDHQKVPGCHYRKAKFYFLKQIFSKFIESFEAGLESEKKQLRCFLPYDSQEKKLLEKAVPVFENFRIKKDIKAKPETSNATTLPSPNMQRILLDPKRKLLLTKNREYFIVSFKKSSVKVVGMIHKASNTLEKPSLVNLKKITLDKMDRTIDKIYNGFLLQARIIDWAVTTDGINTVIEDENGDLERLIVYNWSQAQDEKEVVKNFRPNCMISIKNPHMQLGMGFTTAICVENPELINFDNTSSDKQCHCCGKDETKLIPCYDCHMSLYCSKACQKIDFNIFNHKDVCKYLKPFSSMTYNSLLHS